jgi:5-methylcytosine-specific restriction endonuclease McrA
MGGRTTKEYQRAYAKRRSVYKAQKSREWRARHPDPKAYSRAAGKKTYQRNKDYYAKRNRAYYLRMMAENPRYSAELQRRYPEASKVARQRRIARMANAEGNITPAQWRAVCTRYGNKCLCCGRRPPEVGLTMDHVIPISKGGTHTEDNIQPLCGSCNSRKHTRILDYRPF